MEAARLRVANSINEIESNIWDDCASSDGTFNPFLSHRFLSALEDSGSAVAETGWQPFHTVVETEEGQILGVMPMYLKGHSQGEYVFDHSWADAWHRAGGSYYPKLQSCVPFTPASGRRLLPAPNSNSEVEALMLHGGTSVAKEAGVSSLHFTFLTEQQWLKARAAGFLTRIDQQYHWHNANYSTFDDFLGDLSSKKRKNLKRERRDAVAADIKVEWVTGTDIKEHHWDAFYRFYMDTGGRKWGRPYLTREFFSLIGERLADETLLILCNRGGRHIAGALNFIGSDTLFGRNWGCIEDHRFLHFETCYYQAIEFAISRGLKRVEAGAQGAHKAARGYLPCATYSAHWIADPGFRDAVRRYLDEEQRYVAEEISFNEQHTPFRADIDIGALRGDK